MHLASVILSLFVQAGAAAPAANCHATPLNYLVTGRIGLNRLEGSGLSVTTTDPIWHDDGSVVIKSSGGGFVTKSGGLGIVLFWRPKVAGDLAIDIHRLDGVDAAADVRDARVDPEHITTIVFPSAGCWQINSRIGDASLTFVMNVIKADDAPKALEGRVVDEHGQPIRGVDVSARSGEQTDGDGGFAVERQGVIQFTADGYAPVTMTAEDLDANPTVRMVKTDDWAWKAPACPDGSDADPSITGSSMHFTIPADTRVEHVDDVDYHEDVICVASDCMVLGAGALYTSGEMTDHDFIEGLTAKERQLYVPAYDLYYGSDIIGVRSDGRRSRWTGTLGEDIKYENVSRQAADFFDRIIDSLCWR